MLKNKKCQQLFVAASVAMNLVVIGNLHGSNIWDPPTTKENSYGDKYKDPTTLVNRGISYTNKCNAFLASGEERRKSIEEAEEAAEKARQMTSKAARDVCKIKLLKKPILKTAIGVYSSDHVAGFSEQLFVIIGRMVYSYFNQDRMNVTECLDAIINGSQNFNFNEVEEHISNFCHKILAFARSAKREGNYYGSSNGSAKNIIETLPYIEIATYLRKYTFLCDDKKKQNIMAAYSNLVTGTDLDLYLN